MDFEVVLREYHNVIACRARRLGFIFGVPVEDAMQECYLRLLEELPSYDPGRGSLSSFVSCRLDNVRRRMSSQYARLQPCSQIESDNEPGDEVEVVDLFRVLQLKLLAKLGGRERLVWSAMFTNDEAFATYLRNMGVTIPTNDHVASYLGLGVEAVKWSMTKIKHRLTLLMDKPEFERLKWPMVTNRTWPSVHISKSRNDFDFVRDVLYRRKLDGRIDGSSERTNCIADRKIESYPWGVVVFVRHQSSAATIVAEGEFTDDRDGRISGANGFWRTLRDSVVWYSAARKACME